MNKLAIIKGLADACFDNIKLVEDNSSRYVKRVLLTFNNGLKLSIIQIDPSLNLYPDNLFEIAVKNLNNEIDGSFLDDEAQGDNILQGCDIDKINHYIKKIGEMERSKDDKNEQANKGATSIAIEKQSY